MKFIIQREKFLKSLQLVSGVVERRQTLPILSNIKLVVEKDQLALTATDLEIELIGRALLDAPAEKPGVTTVMARKLIDICRALPNEAMIQVSMEKERLVVSSGKSRFTLATLPADTFPSLEEGEGQIHFVLSQHYLRELISKTYFSMGNEDVRYYLNGMSFYFDNGEMKLIATDGHRLSLITFKSDRIPSRRLKVIVPRKGVIELMRLLNESEDEVKVILGAHHIRIETGDLTFTSKLVDAKCPDYEKLIPAQGNKMFIVDREQLKQALARVAILSNDKHKGVRLALKSNLLKLSTSNPEQEEAEEELVLNYEGDEVDIGFNVNYLIDVCNAVSSSELKISLAEANGGMVINGVYGSDESSSEALYLVMPLRF
jgi:DNA polymerase III subunit beta